MVKKKSDIKELDSWTYLDLGIFRDTKLTVFEALVKFLKKEKGLSFKEISLLLGKDERNIWTVYSRAKKKTSGSGAKIGLGKLDSWTYLDLGIFRDTKLTVFEALVKFLKDEKGLNFKEISLLLGKDERNIWTVYNRGKSKK